MAKHAHPTRQDLHMLYERLQETLPLMERLLQTGQARGPAAPPEAARPPAASSAAASRFHVEKYGARHYALYEGEELLAVTVYGPAPRR